MKGPKVMRSYAKPAIRGQFETGPQIGSMTSLPKQENAQFGKILSKATDFYRTAENKQLNRDERHSQSQEVL
jgi:hypothetical protein